MRNQPSRGFSLIELLVVISVVAVLLTLVIPSLSAAREASRFVVCKSNLRQQFAALKAYASDYRGYGPADINTNGTPGWPQWNFVMSKWMIRLAPYLGIPEGTIGFTFSNAALATSPDSHIKVFQCPTTWVRPQAGEGRSYGFNMFMATDYNANLTTQFKTNGPTRFSDRFIADSLDRLFLLSDSWVYTTHPGQFARTLMDPVAGALLPSYDKSHYVKGTTVGSGRINIVMGDGRAIDRGKGDQDYFGSGNFYTTYYVGTYAQHPTAHFITYNY